MNQRIRELGRNAGAYISEPNDQGMIDFDTSKIDLTKFAQLIVAECVNHIKTVENTPAGFIQPKHSSVLEFELNQHFGTAT